MGGPGSNQDTYWERVKRIFRIMDIRNAFATHHTIERAQEVLRTGRGNLEAAHRLVEATVHPDTGKVISPFFLRLSFIVPANMTLDCFMILAQHPAAIIAAQTANQVYNAAHYYANRNATNTDELHTVALSFAGATASSVTAALSLNAWAARLPPNAAVLALIIRRVAPFLAVACADVLNLAIMRQSEWRLGVAVASVDDSEAASPFSAVSRRAGAMAVASCIASRIAAAAPVLLVSSFAHHFFTTWGPLRARPAARLGATLVLLALAIQVAVPLTFGIFRQDAIVPAHWLEPEILGRAEEERAGVPLTRVRFHKGL